MQKPNVIAIDGTFASGKGTLAKKLAAHYNLAYLDTGKLYRAVAKAVLDEGADPNNEVSATTAAQELGKSDLMAQLADPELKSGPVGAAASKVAVHKKVRAALFQRRHAELVGYGETLTYEDVLAQLTERDSRDMGRKDAPLKPTLLRWPAK